MAEVLTDKVIVITGAAEGIGYAIADSFLEKNPKAVIILDINEKLGAESAQTLNSKYGGNKAVYIKCDVTTDLEAVSKEIFDRYKTVDVLVNNAGITDEKLVRKTVALNVTAVLEWTFKFWGHMRKDKGGNGGTIINVSSICGYRRDQFLPVYKATKHAIMGFTRTIGHTFNYDLTGVRVVALCPGFTKTSLASKDRITVDPAIIRHYINYMKNTCPWQNPDSVGKAAAEVYEKGASGTAWEIEGGKPIVEVP
ncbi:15-hydroxyprostaglandin dehydrogenase [NAD(+)]-like [Galleria mellonella]|uniref:15-hydroxyprostaglandin dehydrogenase [NAD(+)] n=1 Tax=Galleria mellonella TaxID=7137 RepID=A0A6J1W7F8_GALME|nr:15-hydroxyprostaglandin dehydrogenase [NAD(+)]-like [Galleria mellonella]